MIKKLMIALVFLGSVGATHAAPLLAEDFEDVGALPAEGWVFINASDPIGLPQSWGQGDPRNFPAHMENPADLTDDDDYAASGFESVDFTDPDGELRNYLFTRTFSAEFGAVATFYLRGASTPGFFDSVAVGFTDGSADPASFVAALVIDVVPTDDWTQFSVSLDPQGAGSLARLGFLHFGDAETVNYVGLDTLRIDSVEDPAGVPEPASLLIFGIGMAGLRLAQRRR